MAFLIINEESESLKRDMQVLQKRARAQTESLSPEPTIA
ncbi:hypothetical protein cypCar_00001568, partial [Cyprinus carpio]